MYISRILEKDIREYLSRKEIIAILGPRQVGKTTLLKEVYRDLDNAVFLDFEDRETLSLFQEDIKSFVELYVVGNDYLFIDEFQYAKEGGKNLKYIFDNYNTKILISGSSASEMSIHGIKFLVGRVFVFNLYQFSFAEFLKYKNEKLFKLCSREVLSSSIIEHVTPYFKEYCLYGGYPRVVTSETKQEKELVLKNIYNTYFLKEVKEILSIQSDHKLAKLLKALALQVGNLVNYNELAGLTGYNSKEVIDYLHILEKTFISFLSRPFYTNKRIELVKSPKVFFFDNGFRNIVIRDFQPIDKRVDKGMLYENFVATELIKSSEEVNFWRTKSKAEVDFVVNGVPIEVKSNLTKPSFTKSYLSFLDKYTPKKGLFLSEKLFSNKKKTLFRPIFYMALNRQVYK